MPAKWLRQNGEISQLEGNAEQFDQWDFLSWLPYGSVKCVWLCNWADNPNRSRSKTVSSHPLVHLCSWPVRQAAEPAEVTACRQSGTVPLRFVPTESGSSRAAYCYIHLMHMICGSHIVAFTFRVIQTAIRGSSSVGQHKMLTGRMALPLTFRGLTSTIVDVPHR